MKEEGFSGAVIEISDAEGRALIRGPASFIIAAGRLASHAGSARFYARVAYMRRPRTREAWRAWMAARDALRAEILFFESFA